MNSALVYNYHELQKNPVKYLIAAHVLICINKAKCWVLFISRITKWLISKIQSYTCTKSLCKYSGIFIGQVAAYVTNETHTSVNFIHLAICDH